MESDLHMLDHINNHTTIRYTCTFRNPSPVKSWLGPTSATSSTPFTKPSRGRRQATVQGGPRSIHPADGCGPPQPWPSSPSGPREQRGGLRLKCGKLSPRSGSAAAVTWPVGQQSASRARAGPGGFALGAFLSTHTTTRDRRPGSGRSLVRRSLVAWLVRHVLRAAGHYPKQCGVVLFTTQMNLSSELALLK